MNDLTYWVTLALMPHMTARRKNELYVACFQHEPRKSIVDLFEDNSLLLELSMSDEEIKQFTVAKEQLANNAFLVEDLLAQGYGIIPIDSSEYPPLLKRNMKVSAPPVIYTKGCRDLLQSATVGIVGSRNADAISLHFASNMAHRAVAEGKVVVSGGAKGIDQQALVAALEVEGRSIIVLPQGITTYASGYKNYYKPISQGRLLVLSTFAPKTPCIYVAQSDDKGGTWAGATKGISQQRDVRVRYPEASEKNANRLLIQRGAKAVDMEGNLLTLSEEETMMPEELERKRIDEKILKLLVGSLGCASNVILEHLRLEWSDSKMKNHLEKMPEIEKYKQGNRVFYRLKQKEIGTLFEM